jgi:hypothetical protein
MQICRRYYGRNKEEAVEHHIFQAPTAIELSRMLMQMLTGSLLVWLFYFENRHSGNNRNIVVILRHEPIKNAEGVASGDITNAGGATDAQITYAVQVK